MLGLNIFIGLLIILAVVLFVIGVFGLKQKKEQNKNPNEI
jgi:NADH:ubiquinone oxidoreductase subunit K